MCFELSDTLVSYLFGFIICDCQQLLFFSENFSWVTKTSSQSFGVWKSRTFWGEQAKQKGNPVSNEVDRL